jgi:DNA-directed RNA polymerase specialized sigma24 family protein
MRLSQSQPCGIGEEGMLLAGFCDDRFKVAYRVIVALRYWDNCSINEISEFLDVPWNETDRRLRRSILALRAALTKPRFQNH